VRHEIESEHSGRTRLTHVERGAFRFAITVSPCDDPQTATIQPLAVPNMPGRKRTLPYVGVGSSYRPGPTDAELRRQRRRGPKLKFSKSSASLAGWSETTTPMGESPFAGSTIKSHKPSLINRTCSLPQLPSLTATLKEAHTIPKQAMSMEF